MGLRNTFLNVFGLDAPEVRKTDNSFARKSARDFLRYGNRDKLYPTWADIKMPDQDMYRGYSYAVIQKRGNKVASLAKDNLKTWANPEVIDEFQKKDEVVMHPYLTLISDSTKFTEKQFWKNISIYLDLAGRYYLGVVRSEVRPLNPKLPIITTDPSEFIMLNPYEIRRVIDKNGQVAGYIERKSDGRYREWPLHQIIEMRELNPFDPENSQWAMTDAAKAAVYTINQSGDYTIHSLHGNIEAPGIITTDVLLSDQDFANFRERVAQHTKGEPIFGNGTGAIKWDSMQIDLDKAALMDINEINRTTLFAVSGTSKTSLGIEQSGTTRETARVQSEQFVSDTAQPRLEDIVDFLNLDYKKHYTREYKQTGYYIEIKSAVGTDYATETQAVGMRQAQIDLALNLMRSGYTQESAYQFAMGEIDLTDLELEKGLDKPNLNDPTGESPMDGGDSPEPTTPNPTTPTNEKEDEQDNSVDLNELEPHQDLVENGGKGSGNFEQAKSKLSEQAREELEKARTEFSAKQNSGEDKKCDPLENLEVFDTCTCDHDHKIETYINRVSEQEGKVVNESYKAFLSEIRRIEKETINAVATKLTVNAFTQDDLLGKRKKANLLKKLQNAIYQYWWALLPMFANNTMNKRNAEFDEDITFTFTNALQNAIGQNADKVAEGHLNTILDDILEATNKAYTEVSENAAADLIVEAYLKNPMKFGDYFNEPPTREEALKAVQKTDILERNRKIYEEANRMAYEGFDRQTIIKAIRNQYTEISTKRANLIARNETARVFTHSQFEADRQFLNSVGKLDNAYKVLYSRRPENEQDKICPYCAKLIEESNANPIPFEQPFLAFGETLEVENDGKVQTFTANYEDIQAGVIHPNCQCDYHLVFKNDAGEITKTLNKEQPNGLRNASDSVDTICNGDRSSSDSDNEQPTKSLNGGPGSGNFGHAGRPGEVGGSAPSGSVNAESIYWPTTPEERQAAIMRMRRGELITRMRRMKKITSFDDAHIAAMKEAGFTEEQIQSWKEKVLAKQLVNIEKTEKTKELRARAKESPEQTKAIDNITEKIAVSPKDETWLRNNCSPEMAQAFSDEMDKAIEMGIEKGQIALRLNEANVTNGSLGYNVSGGKYNLTISRRILRDYEATLATRERIGPNGTKWWTSGKLNGTFSHEIGHAMEWQFIKSYVGDKTLANGMKLVKDRWSMDKLRDYSSRLIVKEAMQNLVKKGVREAELRMNPDNKYMSRYGRTNVYEAIAESFANPDYSALTKEIYNLATGKTKLGAERDKALKESIKRASELLGKR